MKIEILMNGKKAEQTFENIEDIITYAENIIPNANIIICNNLITFKTEIQILDCNTGESLIEISFSNPSLKEDYEDLILLEEFQYSEEERWRFA